jgi:hypothetical protein
MGGHFGQVFFRYGGKPFSRRVFMWLRMLKHAANVMPLAIVFV